MAPLVGSVAVMAGRAYGNARICAGERIGENACH
jgi:hypothetical protein